MAATNAPYINTIEIVFKNSGTVSIKGPCDILDDEEDDALEWELIQKAFNGELKDSYGYPINPKNIASISVTITENPDAV